MSTDSAGGLPEKPLLVVISSQAASLWNFRGPLIRRWVELGWRVVALAPDYDDIARARVAAHGAQPLDYSLGRAGIQPARDLLDLVRLVILLRRLRPAYSFAYFIKPVIYGGIAARLAGVSRRYAMVEGAGYVFSDPPGKAALGRRMLRWVVVLLYRIGLAGVRKVMFLNREDATMFLGLNLVSAEQVECVGAIGVDLDHFSPASPVVKPLVFILAARLLVEKGVRVYVEAARMVKALHPEIRFILLGSPDQNPGSVSHAELVQWSSEGVIEWQEHVDDVRPWIAQASVFVLPTWYREGVPRSIQEAMAMGRPVITTDMPGCKDAVIAGQTGFIVPPRDAKALAHSMLRFVAEPALVLEMGRAARRFAEQVFDVHAANSRILRAMA